MQDKVASKLSDVLQCLSIAKKYGIDCRMEDKKFAECSIAFSNARHSADERFNKITNESKQNELGRYNTILKELSILESTILDKRKVYQAKEMLNSNFEKIKGSKSEQAIKEYIEQVKVQLQIYNTSKIPEMYSPEIIIKDIFRIVYESIKIEWFKYGKSELLDEVMKRESNINRVNYWLNRDVESLERILESDNKTISRIREYMLGSKEESRKKPVDEKLIGMVVDTIASDHVKDSIDTQTKDMQEELDRKVSEVKKKREKYIGLAKLQTKARKAMLDIKRSIYKRLAPIALSLVIMSGVGLGTYYGMSEVVSKSENTTNISQMDDQSSARMINVKINVNEENNDKILAFAGTATFASLFIPKIGLAFQGAGLVKDKRKHSKLLGEIVSRKQEMEDLKKSLETMVTENKKYSKKASKQKDSMMWASIYTGLSETENAMLVKMNEDLSTNDGMIQNLDEEVDLEETANSLKRKQYIQGSCGN